MIVVALMETLAALTSGLRHRLPSHAEKKVRAAGCRISPLSFYVIHDSARWVAEESETP